MKLLVFLVVVISSKILEGYTWDQKSFQLKDPPHTKLSFLWWNTQFGESDNILQRKVGYSPLNRNLIQLIESNWKPDVLAFGEWTENLFSTQCKSLLKEQYPFSSKFVPYHHVEDQGIKVFSRFPIRLIRKELLDYYPLALSKIEEIEEYRNSWVRNKLEALDFKRHYLLFEIASPSGKVVFAPVHLLTPWERMFTALGKGFWARTYIKLQVLFGKRNPLFYQVQRLRLFLEDDLGKQLNNRPLVLVGDFNLPPKIWLNTAPYNVIANNLSQPLYNVKAVTWPSRNSSQSSVSEEQFQIDFGLHNDFLTPTLWQVLPFQGSDHYALFMGFDMK